MAAKRIDRLPTLPPRRADSHKGDYGRVLVLAGSRGMAGAAALVGASCLRSGAGLVRVACPIEVQPTVASFEPSYMTWPLDQDDQGRARLDTNRERLAELFEQADVVAMGPGLGQGGDLPDLVRWVLETVRVPAVVDADALNALAAAGRCSLLKERTAPTIATPHPGEFSRLTGRPIAEIQARREAAARDFVAQAEHLVLVLKGADTIICDRSRTALNPTGNPGMATGGAGDCLTGVIAALLGQGLDPFEAAQLGAYVHGLAGDLAREQSGEIGLIAGDLVDSLPDAFYHLTASAATINPD